MPCTYQIRKHTADINDAGDEMESHDISFVQVLPPCFRAAESTLYFHALLRMLLQVTYSFVRLLGNFFMQM